MKRLVCPIDFQSTKVTHKVALYRIKQSQRVLFGKYVKGWQQNIGFNIYFQKNFEEGFV